MCHKGEEDMSSYSIGQMNQLGNAFEAKGFTPEEITMLGQSPEILGDVRHLISGTGRVEIVRHVIDCDAMPHCPKGWRIEEADQLPGRVRGSLEWDHAAVDLHLDPSQMDGGRIQGHKLKERLANEPVLPATVLDYLLANPTLIPEDWKKDDDAGNTRYIFFWGSIYRNSDGGLLVRYLCWLDGRWHWVWGWLGYDWLGSNPTARLRK